MRYHPCRDAQSDAAMKSLVSTIALLLLPTVSSLLLPVASTVPRALTLRLPFASTVPPAVTPRTMVTMQEQPGAGSESDDNEAPAAEPDENLAAKQLEMVAGASDPFRYVRTVLYAVFSIVGLAGAGIAVTQGDMVNAGVNAGVLVGGVVAFVLDQKFQETLQAKVKEEMDDPYLKGDMRQEAPKKD